MDMIYKKLKGRRYLAVMDDLWSSDVWDLMTRTFPDDNNGSRIILTSRLNDVAMHADPDSPPHEISLLNVDESWNLLHDKVFGIKQVCPPELEDIGSKTPESWGDVAKSVSIVVADEPDICLGVLAMSYNYLPNHLKSCFLYMGVFPEDSEVEVERMINLWVSEGFLLEERHKSIEEMGRECLEDLLSRNLLMVRKRRWNNEVRTCGVHDLIRDLILREAGKEKFLQVTRNHEATNPSAQKLRVRRYSFHSSIYQAACWESSSIDLTRTLHFFQQQQQRPNFPLEVTKLVHLRYLEFYCKDDIHCCTSELFSAIPNLKRLTVHHEEELTEFERVEISQHLSNFSRLKELEILKFRGNRQYFRRMPGKYSLPTSLNSLTLTDTYLPWEDIANIVMLPNLEVLKIKYHGFYGAFWRLNDNEIFNQLKLLLINETYLKHWDAGSVNFPKLQRLVLKRCFDLEEIPKDFGEICTLESIELHKCKTSAAASAKNIQEEQESMGNDCLSVLINDCSGVEGEYAQDFLDKCQRIPRTSGILETTRVSFTTFQLSGIAFTWWEAYERRRPIGAAPLIWQQFPILYLEKYVPQYRREELHKQFEQLKQDDMAVMQYEMRFS
ncbi:putative late blight resistance protein homolog R1A-10 [Nicotiana sylvestris]|uniref:putative late blight resistance protein homolog R1A-10 n=1 Tax=Nicotiana sylvestris TaxID=4096 RepID=UPI00388C8A66